MPYNDEKDLLENEERANEENKSEDVVDVEIHKTNDDTAIDELAPQTAETTKQVDDEASNRDVRQKLHRKISFKVQEEKERFLPLARRLEKISSDVGWTWMEI